MTVSFEDNPNTSEVVTSPKPSGSSQWAVPIGLAVLLLTAVVFILIETPNYRPGIGSEPGPAIMPLLVAGLSTVAAILLIVQTLRGKHGVDDDGAGAILPVRVIVALAALIMGAFLFRELGFFVVFTLLLFVMGWLSGSQRWWSNLIVAVLTSWIVMIVFGRIFSVPLPAGPLDTLLGG